MKRRDFLQLASASGLVIPYWGLVPIANAQSAGYGGRLLIQIHASGGIDGSSWADPRETDALMNDYARAGTPAGVAGKIRYAPLALNKPFFDRFYRYMRVINGLNTESNSHDDGARCHAVGQLATGMPNIAELFANQHGKQLPMGWLNAGGFSRSVGLVPPTPMPSGATLRAQVDPMAVNATQDFVKRGDLQKVFAAREQRLAALKASGNLVPGNQRVNDQFAAANLSRAMMERVNQYIPATIDAQAAAHVGLICGQAGITSTIQLSVGGFDTHSNHTVGHTQALTRLTNLVSYLWDKAAELNILNRCFFRIYSEFSRTPLINNSMGKDHWGPGGCQILMAPEADGTWGNAVFGASSARHQALRINPSTGALDPVNGVVIRPRHVHVAMREYLGIQTNDPKYDLKVPANERFNIFGPGAETNYPNL
jgi:uncharacterized protein (DUF1501 family)